LIVNPVKLISTYLLWKIVDVGIIDGIGNTAGKSAQAMGGTLKHLQSGYARAYAGWILFGAVVIVAYISLVAP
jgi:NADH:ubiquinone oxidoreductase subunit 5 (subunit L)/multisubunit Na+/H+ antiporter MnhA subunit